RRDTLPRARLLRRVRHALRVRIRSFPVSRGGCADRARRRGRCELARARVGTRATALARAVRAAARRARRAELAAVAELPPCRDALAPEPAGESEPVARLPPARRHRARAGQGG